MSALLFSLLALKLVKLYNERTLGPPNIPKVSYLGIMINEEMINTHPFLGSVAGFIFLIIFVAQFYLALT
jgi:hypothetical protein